MSKFKTDEISEEEIEKIINEDELMANAEKNASPTLEEEEKEEMSEEKAVEDVESEKRFLVPFSKEYMWNGKKINSLDLSGLEDLTTADGEHAEHVMARLGHFPANKFKDTTYTKYIAMKVTGLSLEFFNQLAIRDMAVVTAKVYNYFLLG